MEPKARAVFAAGERENDAGNSSAGGSEDDHDDPPDGDFGHLSKYPLVDRARQPPHEAVRLSENADEVVAAYLAGIRSDDPNRAYRAADAWISRFMAGRK